MAWRKVKNFAFLAMALMALPGPGSASAAPAPALSASPWAVEKQAEVRLIAADAGVGDGQTVTLGVEIRLKPGWKVYWRTPGDAGVAPRFDWRGSRNLASAAVIWPAPRRFSLYGFESFAYLDRVVLPIRATLAKRGVALHLALHLAYGICEKVCIPYKADLTLDLPAGRASPGPFAPLIERYAAQVPQAGPTPALGIEKAWLTRQGGQAYLAVAARATVPFAKPDLIAEGADAVEFAPPEVELSDRGRHALLRLKVAKTEGAALAGHSVILTLLDGGRAIEQKVVIEPTLAIRAPSPQ